MKNIFFYTSILLCLIIPVSCLTSLQPLVTKGNIVTDNRITGHWQHDGRLIEIESMAGAAMIKDSIQKSSWRLRKNDDPVFFSKKYGVVFEQSGARHVMTGALTRINNNLFFELMPVFINDPENPEGDGYEYTIDYLGTFTIGKLTIDNNTLTLQFLNGDFIREQIEKGAMRIKHEKDRLFDSFLITASSNDMQQFLQKYGNDDRLFAPNNSITLTRKG